MVSSAMVMMAAGLFSKDVWAVYGVVVDEQRFCEHCSTSLIPSGTPSIQISGRSQTSNQLITPFSAPGNATTSPKHAELSTEARIGIGVGIGVLAFAIGLLVVLDICYLRRHRREKAILNAIEQVERAADKGSSEERIVLESRVSIVFDDEPEWTNNSLDRGRNGLSLPRRH